MKCIHCGKEISDSAVYCPLCGQKNDRRPNFCLHCGAKVESDMKFCVECGKPIEEMKPEQEAEQSGEIVALPDMDTGKDMIDLVEDVTDHVFEVTKEKETETVQASQSTVPTRPAVRSDAPSVRHKANTQKIKETAKKVAVTTVKEAAAVVTEEIINEGKEVVKETGKTAKKVAIWAAVLTFVLGAAAACLNFFVSPPEKTAEKFITSIEEMDADALVGCLDKSLEKKIHSVLSLSGGIFGLDFNDLLTLFPVIAPEGSSPEIPDIQSIETVLYADCSKDKLMQYCTDANGGEEIPTGYLSDNSIINFLNEYDISIAGLENLIAEAAIVKITAEDTVLYLPLINEGFGDWRIYLSNVVSDALK